AHRQRRDDHALEEPRPLAEADVIVHIRRSGSVEQQREPGHRAPSISTERSRSMSLMKVELIEGVFTADQKSQMIGNLTDVLVQFEGEQARETTVVLLSEVKSGDWGKGGVPLTAQAVMPPKSSKA